MTKKKQQKIPMIIMMLILTLGISIFGGIFSLIRMPGTQANLGIRGFGTVGTLIMTIALSLVFAAVIYGTIKAKKRSYFLTLGLGLVFVLRAIVDVTMTRGKPEIMLEFLKFPPELTMMYPEEILIIIGKASQIIRGIGGILMALFAYIKRDFYAKDGIL